MTLILIMFCLMIVEPIISKYIPFFSYSDEIIVIYMFAVCASRLISKIINSKKISFSFIKMIAMYIMFIFVGLIGNFLYKFQNNNLAIVKDMFAISKMIICYFYIKSSKNVFNEKTINWGLNFIKTIVLVMTMCLVLNFIPSITFFSSGEYRNGIRVYRFIFPHPTFLVASCVAMTAYVMRFAKKKDRYLIFLLQLNILFSMRTKGFIIILILILIALYVKIKKVFSAKLANCIFGISLIFVGIFAYGFVIEKVNETFKYGLLAARPALYIVSGKLYSDCFPIGAGFGTFASSLSGEYYSKIYFYYGINGVLGLTPNEFNYMADTYWPYVLGQFGLIGSVIYVWLLLKIFSYFCKSYQNKNFSNIYITAYIFMASIVETVFTNSTIVLMMLTLGIVISNKKTSKIRNG